MKTDVNGCTGELVPKTKDVTTQNEVSRSGQVIGLKQ